jgi:hypothetical protein
MLVDWEGKAGAGWGRLFPDEQVPVLARSPRSALTQRRRLRFVIPDQVLDRRLRRLPGRLIIKSRFAPRRGIMARTPISHPASYGHSATVLAAFGQ